MKGIILLLLCCSCSASINLTKSQRVALEQKKFERFKIVPREHMIAGVSCFAVHSLIKYNYPKR